MTDNGSISVTVKKITPVNSSGALRGFASVDVSNGRLKINDLRIVQQDGQKPWVSMPQASYERDGKRKWYPIVEVSENLKNIISDAVLKAWHDSGKGGEDAPF